MATKTSDKSKRDEWSAGGVLSLLDVYESKWVLRNRAKLKGSDWEEIAQMVSLRNSGNKLFKTPNQCKNKVESMKKRYRAESAGINNNSISGSLWQFFERMDVLLKGNSAYPSKSKEVVGCRNGVAESSLQTTPMVEMDDSENVVRRVLDVGPDQPPTIDIEAEGRMQESNRDDGSNTPSHNRKDSKGTDSNVSTPRSKMADVGDGSGKVNPFKRRKRSDSSDVVESIRLLANTILKIEQTRMEMFKDLERLRAEAEIRRGELELKRTEIIAKTQLQIAKLLARKQCSQKNSSGSSSVRGEPILPTKTEGRNG